MARGGGGGGGGAGSRGRGGFHHVLFHNSENFAEIEQGIDVRLTLYLVSLIYGGEC